MSAELEFALELADAADAISLTRFGASDLRVERKPDLTPVSDADRAIEQALRSMAGDDGFFGEEFGGPEDGVRWIVDPIDGTKNFVRGIPVWATLIALADDDELVVGVVSAPALGRRWWAARGEGAYANGAPIRVSGVADLADAAVSAALASDLAALEDVAWHTRALGDFWQHVLVAEGALDAAIDYPLKLWDYAALVPIVEEAGGRTGFAADGQFVSSNGLIHDKIAR
ncbi:MAG: histidinol-phosphatase [Gaiellaceae bacterium]|jgi:histidinol-phosphatase|nr:histidinol-phosphatase [Gaiellaceae bacterium]